MLIQRYGINADESREDPGRDDVSRLDEMMSGVVRVDILIE